MKNRTVNFFVLIITIAAISLVATHNVYASLTIDIDRNLLDFRAIDPGDSMEIADQGTYHNEITCTSTNNQTWYLKARLIRPLTYGTYTIPNENFRWIVVSIGDGKGTLYNNLNVANPFTDMSQTIYTSADTDNTGTAVKIRFRYVVTIPKNQVAGPYDAVIRLTMNEYL